MATTASSGTPSQAGVTTRLPSTAMTTANTMPSRRPMMAPFRVWIFLYTSAEGRMKPMTTSRFMRAPVKSAKRMPWATTEMMPQARPAAGPKAKPQTAAGMMEAS